MNLQNHINADQFIREALTPFLRVQEDGSMRLISLEKFNPAANFLDYFDQCSTGRNSSIRNMQACELVKRRLINFFTKKKWIKFHGQDRTPHISFCAITPSRLVEMEEWLLMEMYTMHTIKYHMNYISSIFKRAEKEGIITHALNPFHSRELFVAQERKNWIVPERRNWKDTIISFMRWIKGLLFNLAGVKKKKAAKDLRDVDMEEFLSLDLRKPKEVKARDFFRIVYLSKCHLSNLFRLKWSNVQDDKVTYTASKIQLKGNKAITRTFILTEELKQLIEKYGNPDKSSDAYIFSFIDDKLTEHENLKRIGRFIIEQNRQLAKLSNHMNVKKLSLYYAYKLALRQGLADIKITQAYPCTNYASGTDIHKTIYGEVFRHLTSTRPEVYIIENISRVKFNSKNENLIKRLRAITQSKKLSSNS